MQVPSQMTTRLLCLRCLSSSQARHTSLENDDSNGGLRSNLSIREGGEGGPRLSLPCRQGAAAAGSYSGLQPFTVYGL